MGPSHGAVAGPSHWRACKAKVNWAENIPGAYWPGWGLGTSMQSCMTDVAVLALRKDLRSLFVDDRLTNM